MKILNLGCGEQEYGTHRVDMCKTRATTHVFNVEDGIQFPDEYFDKLYERNLLEHLPNVGYHLQECYRVLKKGGKITLITDNAECIRYYVLGTHTGGYKGHRKFITDDGDRHFAIFTKEHLKNLFDLCGFNIKKIDFIQTDFTPTRILDKFLQIFPSFAYPRIKVTAFK